MLDAYLDRMREIRATGGATNETSYYGALETLLNGVGRQLKPRVIANGQIRNQGAGHPDFGLYGQSQCRGSEPVSGSGALPERGVVEVKGLAEETWFTAGTTQVSQYWDHYGLVLVTNYRAFLLIGRDAQGQPVRLEPFSLAASETDFWDLRYAADSVLDGLGEALIDYLRRALSYMAPLTRASDLAWLLASYARDALRRVEASAGLPALQTVRSGLEQALGLRFEAAKGEHFFRSTLVQTIFYGIFSAWVQWARLQPPNTVARFDWHAAGWTLHVPMVRTLFEQVATPSRLGPLGLVEVLDWTGNALNRVDRTEFFAAFDEGQAVQYFYEPFLAHFDPALRKQLGVWYTPPEIVRYMVARVDLALREELGIAEGLASPAVHVLDPCCGTGSFLVEVLRVVEQRLRDQGEDALVAHDLSVAARNRLFGFELMPAPFVVAHWQIGMLLAQAGAPLSGDQRASIYLTNALTGWTPPTGPVEQLLLPELQPERDAAERVKQVDPILVIIGNPPYNAFAGVSPDEEEQLVDPYKAGLRSDWQIKKFNLDELYARFLRVAERRIVEGSGRGIISFISSYSYLSDPSFVVVRRHLLEGFQRIWVDSLNGDSRETGKRTPDGSPDPSVFSTPLNREGIKLGTAVGMFVRTGPATEQAEVRYRQFWGSSKREELLATLDDGDLDAGFEVTAPTPANRYNFRPLGPASAYDNWPDFLALAEAEPFSGLAEMRRGGLIDSDRDKLAERMSRYMDPTVSFETLAAEGTGPTRPAGRFDPEPARTRLLARETFQPDNIVRYALLPLDTRYAYYTSTRPIWNEPRPDLVAAARDGNSFLVSRMMAERPREGLPVLPVTALPDYHLLRPNIRAFPLRLLGVDGPQGDLLATSSVRANLSARARAWLIGLTSGDPDTDHDLGDAPWYHALATSASPAWLTENHAAILSGWPKVPLPADLTRLQASAQLGRQVAALLDTERTHTGVTIPPYDAPYGMLGRLMRVGGGALGPADLAVLGWGSGGGGAAVMPGNGDARVRPAYDAEEMEALTTAAERLEEDIDALVHRLGNPVDVHLNDTAYLKGVPSAVYEQLVGGYQVLKKWLSYRDQEVIGRPLAVAEVREAVGIVRRLSAYVLLQPALDASYVAIRAQAFDW
ncbi:N-6 DNA methylase (plasmid) [Sphingomonas aliaeris]|uniref:site-specific DNA-methyltransferase (adenine-specific) n=2 Tax=Sphingomonas aliaeris TaxID=2759526 RepID=A0A974NZG0_9SPHN|nr:N-6 DNA methylase [Sphingomonas aliaeris]